LKKAIVFPGEADQSEVVDGQPEKIEGSSLPWRGVPSPNPVNPAFDADARKEFPALLKRGCRPARS
jgi:hypothetical protein